MVDVGPLSPDFKPDDLGLDVCCCRQCLRGLECVVMQQRRAEAALTADDRQWLRLHGDWKPA